ncbi:MAG: GntR family transcriptional regulator [Pseudomonadales bacterium]|nr:GntR family transcriptional regulator [Pseudomonadales bacterium]
MQTPWNDKEPIYHQLRDRLVALIIDGVFGDGDALPSVRQIASEQRINPITVSKAYQLMVDEGLVEKRRGLGMFVIAGASQAVTELERIRFKEKEWPAIQARMKQLNITLDELLPGHHEQQSDDNGDSKP